MAHEARLPAGDPCGPTCLTQILAREPGNQDLRGRNVDEFSDVPDESAIREVMREHTLRGGIDIAEEDASEPRRVEAEFNPANARE